MTKLELGGISPHIALTFVSGWNEYVRASKKHPGKTLDTVGMPDGEKLAALVEEVGEIARCLTYDREHAKSLRAELIQLGMLALAWSSVAGV